METLIDKYMKNYVDEHDCTKYIMDAKDIPQLPIKEPSFRKCPCCRKSVILRGRARKIQITSHTRGVFDGIDYMLTVICPECHIKKTFTTEVTGIYNNIVLNSVWRNLKPSDARLIGTQAAIYWWNHLTKDIVNEMKAASEKVKGKIPVVNEPATNGPTLIDYYYLAYRWPDRSFNISDGKMAPVMMQPNSLSDDAEVLYKSGVINLYTNRLLKRAKTDTRTMFTIRKA